MRMVLGITAGWKRLGKCTIAVCSSPLMRKTRLYRSFPLKQLAALIDAESLLPHPPTSSRRTSFETLTGQPFQYAISVTSGDTLTVNCPSCSLPNTVPWASLEGNGYSQKDFVCTCTDAACGLNFGHEVSYKYDTV